MTAFATAPTTQPTANRRRALSTSARFSTLLNRVPSTNPACTAIVSQAVAERVNWNSAAIAGPAAVAENHKVIPRNWAKATRASMRRAASGLPGERLSLRLITRLTRYMNIPYTRHTLDNGLDVLIHEDHGLPDRRRESLVSRRLEERDARSDRVRAPVRAPDVRRLSALRQGVLPPAPGSGGIVERIHERGPHELLGGRAEQRARAGVVDGIGPYGVSAAGADRRQVREPA